MGFMGTLDWCGRLFSGSFQERHPSFFQSWLTHFWATLYLSDGRVVFVERSDSLNAALCSDDDRQEAEEALVVWEGDVEGTGVAAFISEQRHLPYDFFHRNCKHFIFSLFRDFLKDPRAQGRFGDFTCRAETTWARKNDC
eukprot:Selendium_serpulae@DN54_c0_g1_i1.p2